MVEKIKKQTFTKLPHPLPDTPMHIPHLLPGHTTSGLLAMDLIQYIKVRRPQFSVVLKYMQIVVMEIHYECWRAVVHIQL